MFWIIHKIHRKITMLESLFKIKFRSRHSEMFFKFLISQESVCVGVFLNKVAGPITATLLNRDSNTRDFLWNLRNFFPEHFYCCFWNVSGFQAATIIKKNQQELHVELTSIRREYYVDTSKSKFRRISTSFPRTFSM